MQWKHICIKYFEKTNNIIKSVNYRLKYIIFQQLDFYYFKIHSLSKHYIERLSFQFFFNFLNNQIFIF